MTDLIVHKLSVTTVASAASIDVGTFTNGKCGMLTVVPIADDTETTAFSEIYHCFFDLTQTSGSGAFRNGSSVEQGRHRQAVNSSPGGVDTFWSNDSSGTEEVAGWPELFGTFLRLHFNDSAAGHVISIIVFDGTDVEGRCFGRTGSPVANTSFTPNLIFGPGYSAAFNSQSTSFARYHDGIAIGASLDQAGIGAEFENTDCSIGDLDWMEKTPSRTTISRITSITATGFVFNGHAGPVVGLCVATGGQVSQKSFTIPNTAIDDDTLSPPDAGFDLGDGCIIALTGNEGLNTDFNTAGSFGFGIAVKDASSQRAEVAFNDGTTGITAADTGVIVSSIRVASTRVQCRASIDAVKRDPLLTIDEAPGVTTGVVFTYIETADTSVVAQRSYQMMED